MQVVPKLVNKQRAICYLFTSLLEQTEDMLFLAQFNLLNPTNLCFG